MCSLDEVRFWTIREIGKVQEANKYTGKHLRILMNDVDLLKAQMAGKADASQSVLEFDKVREEAQAIGQRAQTALDQTRQQVGDEMAKAFAQLDASAVDAKISSLVDMVQAFSLQVQEAFNQVGTV